MIHYDGLKNSFGVHTVRVHLQAEEYKGYLDFKMEGNTKGVDVCSFDFADWEDEDFKVLKNSMHNLEISGFMSECDCGDCGYDEYIYKIKIFKEEDRQDFIYGEYTSDEANCLIVGIEIIDFKREQGK